jgi:hypothetical protein
MAIYSRLLICMAKIGEALYYAKLTLKVGPYFYVLALLSYIHSYFLDPAIFKTL